jgi:hypothetical protein
MHIRGLSLRILHVCLLIYLCLFADIPRVGAQTSAAIPNTGLVWPNAQSKANSDDWIRLHHQQIKQMQPRLLILNFVNGLSNAEAAKKTEALIAAIRESSRYHGYARANAPAFLDYKIYKVVDLTDPMALPDDVRFEGNSSKYPRTPDWKPGMVNFQYGELYGDKFARYYNIPDPADAARMLSLRELVERGIIHEVWFLANQGKFGDPLECIESKQAYDENMRKYPDRGGQAGGNVTDQQPFIGRSLRILFINPERGPGVPLTALGRSLESMATVGAIPYFSRYFREYAGFDLKKRFHLPFDRLSERNGTELDYPDESTLAYVWKGERRTLHPYVPVGGSVPFTPTARHDYDQQNPASVLSTIEHYRLLDGPDGKDRAAPWTNARFARYQGVAPDGVGPWMVYWRQNMPGLDNPCKDDTGKPMLNWWPFLFY